MPDTIPVPTIGATLADIPLVDAGGATTRLTDQIAGGRSVLFFMRAADCPVCIGHSRTLARMAAAGELNGARAIAIAPGDAADAAKTQSRIDSPLVAVFASGDHHADLGLGRFLTLQHSGTFVLDADGTVLSVVTSPLPTASFSKGKILAALG